ncbi:FecR domain-containing protein [Bradyrhizobium liaoningense]|uniref:FecR domain-containing protein n=1 Tax=Bradyrhizobium liaoningense TaxID=43992 RepID=UPI001BA56361|nr:FecR domain-containing protein [Bradyrhizobium liaoningense]MBR0842386.1 FecR domain-containing protein [Bradyrhizobium liaoningense]
MAAWRRSVFALALLALPLAGSSVARASDAIEVAQAQPQAQPAPAPSPTPSAAVEPIGNVATVTGIATVIRDKNSYPLRVRDDIYLNDVVQTSSNSALGITFNDATTFNLSASARITIDNYVYEEGGKQNSAIVDIGKGTVAFVAAAVAKTGDMKITTPTATLGIRGTTGVVDVPEGAAANRASNVNIKLYPDADGRVGHIDVDDRSSGTRLGALTQGASGFAIRPGAGGPGGVMRLAAVPITIPAQQIARDRGFVSQVHLAQTTGRQIVTEQRDFRRANPTANPRIPRPLQPQQQQLRPTTAPGQQPQRPNDQPGQNNRPGQQQPGAPGRQGAQPPQRQGQGQGGAVQPATPRAGQGQQRGQQQQGQPQQGQQQQGPQQGAGRPAGAPRTGQGARPGGVPQPQRGQPPQSPGAVTPPQPGTAPQAPHTGLQPGQPAQPPAALQPGGIQRQGGFQQRLPGVQRPAAPRRPEPREKKERR